jgi:mRNA interferase RelE/StbE
VTKTEQRWEVIVSRQAAKVLQRLPQNLLARIDEAIRALAADPWPPGCKKLSGTRYDNLYRVRVGDWRISYAVEEDELIVLVLEVSTRGDAYRL